MINQDRFQDTARGVIIDTQYNNIEWLPKDSYGDLGKWVTFQEGVNYAQLMNQVYAGGQSDWRLPNEEEILRLYDQSLIQKDWETNDIHISPVFLTGCSHYLWSDKKNDAGQIIKIDLRTGDLNYTNPEEREHNAVRLIRFSK